MSDKNGEADLEPEQQRKLFVGGVNYKTTGVLHGGFQLPAEFGRP